MFDVKKVQDEAEKEIAAEKAEKAKGKIKAKLKEIDNAKKILRNLEIEYADLIAEIGAE